DSIMYTYSKATFTKTIYRQYNCVQQEKVYSGKAPRSPLQNSNYDASFIAGMLQLRYVYSMPVERIVKYFTENGFELNKSTAHGLIKKSAGLMDRLDDALHTAILEDNYLCMDESYHTILTKEKNKDGKGVRKGYIWAALANKKKLIQYFYENGSRSREVLTNYIGNQYKGAIQSDGLINYKILETDAYPDIIRLACFQHCKREFLDIENDKEAIGIVNIINRLYQAEHKIEEKWPPDKILKYRQKYAPPILAELKNKLLEIQSNPSTLPKSPLSKATNYTLNEYDSLCNYILSPDYALDNNAVERCMRSISLSRKNSLFCGSHQGAKRTALLYSLAISCKLHGINTFEYFTDILSRLAYISPTAPDQIYRDLLPDKWTKL
ncbi:MAG: IS66 family transposase, partial [Parabacteroides sp.]|nr:IS66 family transposase [Parabacteroides sp.]